MTSKREVFPFEGAWRDAFGQPETTGVWLIWGLSGSGKSTFAAHLAKYLSQWNRVAYNSLEEGTSLTLVRAFQRAGITPEDRNIHLLTDKMEALEQRLEQRRSYEIVIIDSFQYTGLNYKRYIELKEKFRHKLIIFISHAEGSNPAGRSAVSVKYDASLKIYVNSHRAFSMGRFIGPVGHYDIWADRSQMAFGDNNTNNTHDDNDNNTREE